MSKRTIVAPEAKMGNRVHVREEIIDLKEDKEISKVEVVRQNFTSLSDQVAESAFYFRNYKYPGGNLLFAEQPQFHFVDKYYPVCKKGVILVDEPRTDAQKNLAYEKHRILKKAGHLHIVIEEGFDLIDCLVQLEEI